jgi:hypothetical protein
VARLGLHSVRIIAGWTVACFTLAVLVACIAQDPDHAIIFGLLLAAWILAPTLAASGLVLASATRTGAAAFLGLELVFVGTTVLGEVLVTFFSQSPYDGLALFLLPFVQWILFAASLIVASLAGWRDRDEQSGQEPRNVSA